MKITILGGGGFLGRKIAHRLANEGTLGGKPVTGLTLSLSTPGVGASVPAAGVANGCSNPTAGTLLATTTVAAGGVWVFPAVVLNANAQPPVAYVYSPTFGGCTQTTVQ